MKHYAILVAGGSGNRMQNTVAKQFLLLAGRPVLMHTIAAFYKCVLNPEILVVLNIAQHAQWKSLCQTYQFDLPHRIIPGGAQRFHSVKNGLDAIEEDGLVAVHDAARPLVSAELIYQSYLEAAIKGNCIVGVTPTDSLRKINESQESRAINRNEFVLVQTPQTFLIDVLKKCYQVPFREEFTDDASVVEFSGHAIHIIKGERENIKLTYPEDLEIAEILFHKKGR